MARNKRLTVVLSFFLAICIGCYATPYYVRPQPLYFIQQPQSFGIIPGTKYGITPAHGNIVSTEVSLTCSINAQHIISGYDIEMFWEFNGNIVADPSLLVGTNSNAGFGWLELTFQHLNESHAGRYRCVVQDGLFSIVSEVAEVITYGFYGFTEPSTSSVMAHQGDTVVIDCQSNNTFPSQFVSVFWYKNGAFLQFEPNQARIVAIPDGLLVISNVTDSDAGNYTCNIIIPKQPHIEKTTIVEVGAQADLELVNTSFVHKPQNVSSHSSSNVYLLCVATGNVLSQTWLKDGVAISDGSVEYRVLAEGSVLNITKFVEGVYTCVVDTGANQTISSSAWLLLLTPPVIADSMNATDVHIEVPRGRSPSWNIVLSCPINSSFPLPKAVWVHNGVPVDGVSHESIVFDSHMNTAAFGYVYILNITIYVTTYEFFYDNVIGMYQCFVSNDAGHAVINRRILFRFKFNPVDTPILHDLMCEADHCGFNVTWNRTDYFGDLFSHVNYAVYISFDGDMDITTDCVNVHSTTCVVHYDITEIQFGFYAAAVKTVYSLNHLSPDTTSDFSKLSNTLQLDTTTYPSNGIKPCELACSSYNVSNNIHMSTSWDHCPQSLGYGADNYIVFLNCSYLDDRNVEPQIFVHKVGGHDNNHTFEHIPCYQDCNLVVRKLTSVFNGNSNSTVKTCRRTPKLGPQSAVNNLAVIRDDIGAEVYQIGTEVLITFSLPPRSDMCFDELSHVLIKWTDPSDDSFSDQNVVASSDITLTYAGNASFHHTLDAHYQWKTVDFAVSFSTLSGLAPWSKWIRVLHVTNRDIDEHDFDFQISRNPSSWNSITVSWTLTNRAKSMKKVGFISNFQYTINNETHKSLDTTYTFSNLSADTLYTIVGKVLTSDEVTQPSTSLEFTQSVTISAGPQPDSTEDPSLHSKSILSDTVIIVITSCLTVVVLAIIIVTACICCKSRRYKSNQRCSLDSDVVVSHHLLEQNNRQDSPESSSPSTHSDIAVPTTPKCEFIKNWFDKRIEPADGEHAPYSENINPSDGGGQDDDMRQMLAAISNKPFSLQPPPTKRRENNLVDIEVHKSFESHSEAPQTSFFSDKDGYTKIASDAAGASTSGGSTQFVPMTKLSYASKASLHNDEITQFCSPSKSFQTMQGVVSVPRKDSSANSSESASYLENRDSVPTSDSIPYIENESVKLPAAPKPNREITDDHLMSLMSEYDTPSLTVTSSISGSSTNQSQVEGYGYVSEKTAILLGANKSIHPIPNAGNSGRKYVSTSETGSYIPYNKLDTLSASNNATQQEFDYCDISTDV